MLTENKDINRISWTFELPPPSLKKGIFLITPGNKKVDSKCYLGQLLPQDVNVGVIIRQTWMQTTNKNFLHPELLSQKLEIILILGKYLRLKLIPSHSTVFLL